MEYSEKFKNTASSIKESLNLSKILGGLMGKSNNYESQNDSFSVRGNKKNKKNPQISTVGPNQAGKLKAGDSSADILAKMYNFMEKNYQDEVKKYEIEKAFHQEQIDEDKKRHKKLIEGLMSKEEKSEESKKGESWIEKMLSGMKSALGILLSPVKLLFSIVGGLSSFLKNFILIFSTAVLEMIQDSFKIFAPTIAKLIKGLLSNTGSIIAKLIPGPIGAAIALAFGAYEEKQAEEYTGGEIRGSDEYKKLYDERFEEERKRIQEVVEKKGNAALDATYYDKSGKPETGYKNGKAYNITVAEKIKNDIVKEYDKKIIDSLKKYEDEILTPEMEKLGFQPKMDEGESVREKGTRFQIYEKKDESGKYVNATLSDYVSSGVLTKKFEKKLTEEISTLGTDVSSAAEKIQNKVFENPEVKSFIEMIPNKEQIQNYIPKLEDTTGEYFDKGKNAATTVINKVNNIGNLKDEIKQLQPSRARDDDSTILKVITNSTIPV